ncbi:MAG TPA: hypothetical protein VFM53_16565, partial [Anaeromyxobacteraceae bacterium]|nr:hypothetical protein [Anaeromyxobacteraceae bacterium]
LGSTTQFDAVGGAVGGGFVAAENVHFSLVFAGAPSATRTITGSRVVTYVSASTRADSFTAPDVPVEALVFEGGSSFRSIPGTFLTDATGAPTGVFTIPDVPSGFYVLHVQGQLIYTTSNAPDLGFAVPGRLDPPMTASVGSSLLDVSLSLGEAWQAQDQLELIGTENNMWDFDTERLTTLAPADTAARFTIDLGWFNGGASRHFQQPVAPCAPGTPTGVWCGDRLHVAHLSTRTSASGVAYQQISEIAQFGPFTTLPGGTQTLDATLAPVSITKTADLDFRGGDFKAAIVQDGNPGTTFGPDIWVGGVFGIVGQPGLASDGFYSSNADMALVEDPVGTNLRTGAFTYASPDVFGGNWGEIAFARWRGRVQYALPGARPTPPGRSLLSGFDWTDRVANLTVPAVVEPKVTMPTGITVTGTSGSVDFFAGGTGIGQNPVISWSPPRVGVPDLYSLTVYVLSVQANGVTRWDRLSTTYTPGTQIHFRAGALQAGRTYVFSLAAHKKAQPAAPFRTGLGDFAAFTPSGMFTP